MTSLLSARYWALCLALCLAHPPTVAGTDFSSEYSYDRMDATNGDRSRGMRMLEVYSDGASLLSPFSGQSSVARMDLFSGEDSTRLSTE